MSLPIANLNESSRGLRQLANESGVNFTEVTGSFTLGYFALLSTFVSAKVALSSEVSTQTKRNACAIAIASALIGVYNIYNFANRILYTSTS